MKKILTLIITFSCLVTYGDAVRFIAGDWILPSGQNGPTTKMLDGTDAPAGNLITGIRTPNTESYPPTTNSSVNYVDLSVGEGNSSYGKNGTTVAKNELTGFPDPIAGEYLFEVGGNAGQNGYIRIYSSSNVIDSVYYINTIPAVMKTSPPWNLDGGLVCSNLNPAYVILFNEVPTTNGADGAHITCSVANVGTGNNQFPASLIYVDYKLTNDSVWIEGGSGSVDFDFVPGESGDYDVRLRADSLRPGLPISETYTVTGVTPEPGLITILAFLCLAFVREY